MNHANFIDSINWFPPHSGFLLLCLEWHVKFWNFFDNNLNLSIIILNLTSIISQHSISMLWFSSSPFFLPKSLDFFPEKIYSKQFRCVCFSCANSYTHKHLQIHTRHTVPQLHRIKDTFPFSYNYIFFGRKAPRFGKMRSLFWIYLCGSTTTATEKGKRKIIHHVHEYILYIVMGIIASGPIRLCQFWLPTKIDFTV